MEFRILGPVEVVEEGRSVELGGQKQHALLALLLLDANRVVPRDRLIDALWDGAPPDTAQKALQVYVSNLRKHLGRDRIVTKAPGYAIQVQPGELDLDRFEHLAEHGGRQQLAEALALWRGPPLADVAQMRFALPEMGRLEERRLAVLEERIDADLALGRQTELIAELESLVAEHPLRERLRALEMLALYRSGRQAEALEAYQDARRTLVEELGIEPSRELRALHQQILNQDPVLDVSPTKERQAGDSFVGREAELAELVEGVGDAFSGRGRLFLLQGEPGIGKSRLAEELVGRASARGATVLVGRCWEAGGAPAYWPWTQSLRAYVRKAEPSAVRRQLGSGGGDVAQIVPELRELFSHLPEPEPHESEAARFRLFDSTASFLREAASEAPLVLVLDDLHAADEPSLLLLTYVASVLGGTRILVVGTFRDLDPTLHDPLESALAELARGPATRRIRLTGLSEEEVGRLAEVTAQTEPPKELLPELYAETEGNPLFVSEIVRLLAAEGRLGPESLGSIPIPETIREAIGRRLRRLSGECRRVLSLASIVGREFGLVALERVADYTGIDKLLAVLDEAVTARVVEEVPGAVGRLRFGHALTRDTLYEEIPATHRARLHRRAGEVLEALYAGAPEPHLAELAHHFALAVPATPPEKAVEYAKGAGERAFRLVAYEEAVRLYRMALESLALGPSDESTRCELLILLAEAQEAAGQGMAGKETFVHAADIARKLGAHEQFARAALGYGGRFAWPRRAAGDARLVPLLEEALAVIGEGDSSLRAGLLTRLACSLRDELAFERRDSLSREAVEIARRLGDREMLVYTLMGRRLVVWAPENVDELLDTSAEIVRLADEVGEPERAADARLLRLEGHLISGDIDKARADLDEAGRLATDAVRPSAHWHVEVHRAELALLEGRFPEAERHIAEAARLGEQAQVSEASIARVTQTFALRWSIGGLHEVSDALDRIAQERPARAVYRCLMTMLQLELGDEERARRMFDALGADEFGGIARDPEWMLSVCLLVEAAASLGDDEAARRLYRMLEPYADLVVVSPHDFGMGSAARSLGVAATSCGRLDAAGSHFDSALALNTRIGARPWFANTQENYARMLLARGDPVDVDRARAMVGSAVTTYRELGMESYAARASSFAGAAVVQASKSSPR